MSIDINTPKDFEDHVMSQPEIILDFWAPWCGPCRMMSPILEQFEEQTGVKVAKVNVDENIGMAKAFGVGSIPMFLLMRNGEPVRAKVGAMSLTDLKKFREG